MSVTSVRTAQLLRSQSLEAQQTPQGEHSHNIVVAVDNSGDLKVCFSPLRCVTALLGNDTSICMAYRLCNGRVLW